MTALFKKKPLPIQDDKSAVAKAMADRPVELKTLLKWEAPVRPFKKRDREYYTTILAIVFLLAVILLFLKEWLLIAVIVALMFVAYVLATVPPDKTSHEITTRGVITSGKVYKWEELKRFWFSKKWQETILHIETKLKFPGRLMMLLGEVKEERVKELMEKQVQYEEPEETFMDRSAKWLSDKIPLEKEN